MAWYELNEKNENKREYLMRVKYQEILCKRVQTLNDIIGCKLEENSQYRFISEYGFNAISVLMYLRNAFKITEIYIAIYRMNQVSVNILIEIFDEGKIKCNIILSSFFRENKKYEKWAKDLVLYAEKNNNIKLIFAHNHAKVLLVKTNDKHIVFEGSGNMSDNARIEQYLIENNKKTYHFHKRWMDEILNAK